MKTSTTLSRLAGATAIAVALTAGPAVAVEDATDDAAEASSEEEEEGGKIQLAETPRDRVGLVFLGALGLMALGGGVTAARQLGGRRPQADGEFRWR